MSTRTKQTVDEEVSKDNESERKQTPALSELENVKCQVEKALENVDQEKIGDVVMGHTKIQRNKAVILAWNQQRLLPDAWYEEEKDKHNEEEEGFLFYVAVRYKKGNLIQAEETEDSMNDNDSGMGDSGSSLEQRIESPSFDALDEGSDSPFVVDIMKSERRQEKDEVNKEGEDPFNISAENENTKCEIIITKYSALQRGKK